MIEKECGGVVIFNDIIRVNFHEEVTFELTFIGSKFILSHLSRDFVKTGSQAPVKAEEIASYQCACKE